jgi:hypothetical protein
VTNKTATTTRKPVTRARLTPIRMLDVPVTRHSQQANSLPVMTESPWPLRRTAQYLNAKAYYTPIRVECVLATPFTSHGGQADCRGHSLAPLYLRHCKYRLFEQVSLWTPRSFYATHEGTSFRFCWSEERPLSFFTSVSMCYWQFSGSWGISVSIVSGYRLDDRGSIAGRGKGYFL